MLRGPAASYGRHTLVKGGGLDLDAGTYLVAPHLGRPNAALFGVAAGLAASSGAELRVLACCAPRLVSYNDDVVLPDELHRDRPRIEAAFRAARAEFDRLVLAPGSAALWQEAVTFQDLARFLADEARSADLVVIPAQRGPQQAPDGTGLNVGALALQAGRAVLVVPPDVAELSLDHVLIAWKDRRECRRAVADALPLLRRAGQVTILELTEPADCPAALLRLEAVSAWLARHGIAALARAEPLSGGDGMQIEHAARQLAAGLIVAGAYGHCRLQEWMFGGVTRTLLSVATQCLLLSH